MNTSYLRNTSPVNVYFPYYGNITPIVWLAKGIVLIRLRYPDNGQKNKDNGLSKCFIKIGTDSWRIILKKNGNNVSMAFCQVAC